MQLLTKFIGGIIAILQGLWITLKNAFRKPVTIQYAYAPRWSKTSSRPIADRYRGRFQLIVEPETGELRCTACKMCAQACPGRCITVAGENRKVTTYAIELEKCLFCGLCVEACPFEALGMTKEFAPMLTDRRTLNVDLAWLRQPAGAPMPGMMPSTAGGTLRPGKKPYVPKTQKAGADEAKE